jgi:hypothetical protein
MPLATLSIGQLQFITASTYRRAPVFLSDRFRRCPVQTLSQPRLVRMTSFEFRFSNFAFFAGR